MTLVHLEDKRMMKIFLMNNKLNKNQKVDKNKDKRILNIILSFKAKVKEY